MPEPDRAARLCACVVLVVAAWAKPKCTHTHRRAHARFVHSAICHQPWQRIVREHWYNFSGALFPHNRSLSMSLPVSFSRIASCVLFSSTSPKRRALSTTYAATFYTHFRWMGSLPSVRTTILYSTTRAHFLRRTRPRYESLCVYIYCTQRYVHRQAIHMRCRQNKPKSARPNATHRIVYMHRTPRARV